MGCAPHPARAVSPRPELPEPKGPIERLPEEWEALLSSWGEPKFRAKQVFGWIHGKGVCDPEQMTNLPKRLRAKLVEDGLAPPLDAIAFGAFDGPLGQTLLDHGGARFHLAGKLDINTWGGRQKVQLRLDDAARATG